MHLVLVTVVLTYIQQNDATTVQWVPIFMNLVVNAHFNVHSKLVGARGDV